MSSRRDLLRAAGAASALLPFTRPNRLFASDAWRTFEVVTRVEVLNPSGATMIWVPAALTDGAPFQKTLANTVDCPDGIAKTTEAKVDELGIITAEFPAGVKPVLTVTSRVATRDWTSDESGNAQPPENLDHWLRPTKLLPTDGIVKKTATKITSSSTTDIDKARAIYEWIVENTYRNPKTRGCGAGNIRFMLESGDLGGKCADLNALYVGLARAAGLPARDVYGLRIARSELGYKSLGTATNNSTKAQHCRAEVYLKKYGWFAVDPADVRKVMLEEPPGNRLPDDDLVKSARARLFGSWEMNWMAYNFAHDVALPGSSGAPIGFFMYPQAETGEGRLDSLDPDSFKYEITCCEVTG